MRIALATAAIAALTVMGGGTAQAALPATEGTPGMPHCANEDGSGGPLPCTWNIGPGVDGNGYGLAYYVTAGKDGEPRFHLVS